MAEAVLFHVAGEILMKLSSQASTRLGMVCGVEDDLTKLRSTVSTIKDVLLDAEGCQIKTHSLQNWLVKLEEALYDAEDVLDELSGETLRPEVMTRGKNAKPDCKEVSKCFELKIWVWVSDPFEVKVVVEKIIESTTKNNPNVKGMEALQSELQEVIGRKKYLLVMDDVWNESEEKWHELKPLLMGGARGSKIMITKRDSNVATEIENMASLFILEGLLESNSWSLFRKVAFKEGKEPANQNLIRLEKEILVKCGGVPLVIRHIGRLLYSKTSEEEWMSFKNNELLEVIQQDNDMMSILKLSYNHLRPNLKQCFAYSSLFSKGKSLKINE